MDDEKKTRLGRGLAALIGGADGIALAERNSMAQRSLPIEFLRPNPRNPRERFDDASLNELAESIKENGLIQPIIVRNADDNAGHFEIIAGERRWRAAQKAGLHEVPIIIVQATERQALELAIVENVQREDLNAIDEGRGYEKLANEFGYTQADLAKVIGKSRSHIANTLRLLKLSPPIKELISSGKISPGHGRALLMLPDADRVAQEIAEKGLSVRDVERLLQNGERTKKIATPKAGVPTDPDTQDLERSISNAIGMKTQIKNRGDHGSLTIHYTNLEQLDFLRLKLIQND